MRLVGPAQQLALCVDRFSAAVLPWQRRTVEGPHRNPRSPLGLFRARLGTTASPRGKLSLGGGGLARRFRTLYRRFRLFGGRFGAPIEDSDDSGAASSNDADR
jgi:hypothetical protein